jgi:hypothetical protein
VKAATKQPTLPENEWSFDEAQVLDDEVEICCYWEYARESAFIQSVRDRCRRIAGCGQDIHKRKEFVGADFQRIRNALGRKSHLFQEGIYALGGTACCEDAISPFPQAWQSLPPDMRRILLETARWTPSMVADFPAFRWSNLVTASSLAKKVCRLHPHPKDSTFPLEPHVQGSLNDKY